MSAIAKLAGGGTAQVEIVAFRATFAVDADPVAKREDQTLDKQSAKNRLADTQAAEEKAAKDAEDAKSSTEQARDLLAAPR